MSNETSPHVIDVDDATFETEVIERSFTTPVIVDFWAPWCGPCQTLGPILEKVVDGYDGQVILAKINVDEAQVIPQIFQVQGIPAVHAIKSAARVDGFVGGQFDEAALNDFVERLLPTEQEAEINTLIAAGDEASLIKVLEYVPDHPIALPMIAELLVDRGESEMALELLSRMPETAQARAVAAKARLAMGESPEQSAASQSAQPTAPQTPPSHPGHAPTQQAPQQQTPPSAPAAPQRPMSRAAAAKAEALEQQRGGLITPAGADVDEDETPLPPPNDEYDVRLTELLDKVKADDKARQEFLDILEVMGPQDPRTGQYRRQLATRLF